MAGSAEALERFQRQTAIPMLVLALATLPLIVVLLLLDLPPSSSRPSPNPAVEARQPHLAESMPADW